MPAPRSIPARHCACVRTGTAAWRTVASVPLAGTATSSARGVEDDVSWMLRSDPWGGARGGPAHAGLPAGEPTCYLKGIKGTARTLLPCQCHLEFSTTGRVAGRRGGSNGIALSHAHRCRGRPIRFMVTCPQDRSWALFLGGATANSKGWLVGFEEEKSSEKVAQEDWQW